MNKISPVDVKEINAKLGDAYPLAHPWHNAFHLEMPFGLINDPNGLVYADGVYHIFYQWNPLGCEHKNKCWAHVESEDLVNYTVPELAMQPTDIHDKNGCYSGCGFAENGQVRIFYTCNSKDENGVRTPAQRFGTLQADGTIRKDEIAAPKEAPGYTVHYRDPYLFTAEGKRYFMLGAQNEALKGRAVVYVENDGRWDFKGEINTDYREFGYMWECPNLLRFEAGDVLLFCPQGLKAEEYAYQNRYQCGYVTGKLDLATLDMQHGEFRELDRGFDFYAPQVMEAGERKLLLGWMGMPEDEALYPTAEHGWIYNLTVPRELELKDGVVYQKPAKEMQALRRADSEKSFRMENAADFTEHLARTSEIELELELDGTSRAEVSLVFGEEKLTFAYDKVSEVMKIDRTGMKLGGRGTRSFKLKADSKLKLQLLVDKTAVEAFFQDGLEAAAVNVFPEADVVPELVVSADKPLKSLNVTSWELGGYTYKKK